MSLVIIKVETFAVNLSSYLSGDLDEREGNNQDIRHLNVHRIKESSYISLTRDVKA